jgi:hypothetical protein
VRRTILMAKNRATRGKGRMGRKNGSLEGFPGCGCGKKFEGQRERIEGGRDV